MPPPVRSLKSILFKKALIVFLTLFSFEVLGTDLPAIISKRNNIYARFFDFTKFIDRNSEIVDIEQDRFGYMWFAGKEGLFRFDGNRIIHYMNDWTPGSLPSTQVNCIVYDNNGAKLWVGTTRGLCYYDYTNGQFIPVFSPDSNENPSGFNVRNIFSDGDSLLWFATLNGYLRKMNKRTFQIIEKVYTSKIGQPYYHYGEIYRRGNNIWTGDRGAGPYIYHTGKKKLTGILASKYKNIPGKKRGWDTGYFLEDKAGNFFIGSTDGVYVYDDSTSNFLMFWQTSSWAATTDYNGNIWFSFSGGLAHYFPETGKMITYQPNEEDVRSLLSNYIVDIFEDNYHQLWIATGKGVSVLKPENPGVEYFFHIPGIAQSLASSVISALAVDSSGRIWVGTSGNGIDLFDPDNKTFTHFKPDNTTGMPSGNIRTINISPEGTVYCGLWAGKGFGILHPNEKRFECFTYEKNNTVNDWYSDMVFENNNLYLGFWGADGLTLFDTKKKKFGRSLKDKFNSPFYSRRITSLEKDNNGNIWMGCTSTGLHLYFPEQDTSLGFLNNIDPLTSLPEKKIFDIKKDITGNLWISAGELYYADASTFSVKKIQTGERAIFSVLPAGKKEVWLMTDKGLLKYDRTSKNTINFTAVVNIRFDENNASGILLKSGKLMFGGYNGLVILDPEMIKMNMPAPKVFLSSLLVFGNVKFPNIESHDNIVLNYNENFFTVCTGSNEWGTSEYFKYYYKLEGFNNEWILMPNDNREANFTNVPPGDYLFRIKVEDKQGNEYPDIATCSLSVIPPFWQRWWFILVLGMAVLTVTSYVLYSRFQRVNLALSNSELNQKLLRIQMNPHFIFNSLFAIQNFIYSKKIHEAGNYLSDFAGLIRLILENSRSEYISIAKETETVKLYLELQKLRFDNKSDYHIEIDPKLLKEEVMIPPMLAQPFLENAIEHGLKESDKKGFINVKYQAGDNMIRFSVEDNGIGLTASKKMRKSAGKDHESLAITICRQRLDILRRKKGGNITFVLEEIKNEDGSVAGTKVSFNIPY
jgi:ligand-binding sensor domain-containing protein